MMEQPESLSKTFESEFDKLNEVSELIGDVDKVYLIGCGSSISTCYSVRGCLVLILTSKFTQVMNSTIIRNCKKMKIQ